LAVKKNIIRILLLALWIVLGSSVLVLLVAAISIKNHKSCKGIDIEIVGVKDIFFLDKADIMQIVKDDGIAKPAGMAITGFNLQRLESMLEKNVWVKDAELFFDNNLMLHINILEKEPVARVFANNGSSFYIDSTGSIR
jgi:cell division protein FtsQ